MIRCFLLALLLALSLSCASSGRSEADVYPWGMSAFSPDKPPKCPYEEVGRITYDQGARGALGAAGGVENLQKSQRADYERKEQLWNAYDEYEADAFIEPRERGGVREFSFIQFTDADCRE